jgi:ATP-dependent helicase YprA (DUF1998 family)
MKSNIPQAVQHLIAEYRRFLRTSYRFLDPELRRQFEEHLEAADVVVKGPYVTLAREFRKGATLADLIAQGTAHRELGRANWAFGKRELYRHQQRALEIARKDRSLVITTGTGSGKTEAFLLPVLDAILRRKEAGTRGVQAILLYPMNALANDQLERLRRLLRGSGLDLSFALYTGDSEKTASKLQETPAETEVLGRERIRREPPDILLTNFKQLEFLLIRKEDRKLFSRALRYLVLDEIHSYRGALATEIAYLIRRMKAHAGLQAGELRGIGTSATAASAENGAAELAGFASTLYGEEFHAEDIVGEDYETRHLAPQATTPPVPDLDAEALATLDPANEKAVRALAERLTSRPLEHPGSLTQRLTRLFSGNRVAEELERIFSQPTSLEDAAHALIEALPERRDVPPDRVRLEIEAYLLLGSIGDEDDPPRLRPKLHTFFHGVYDVALCMNPSCRKLVPHGSSKCPNCGSQAFPAALCRTCGQDFAKARCEHEGGDVLVGTGDFFSTEQTVFLTHRILALGSDDEDEEAEAPNAAAEGSAQDAHPTKPETRKRKAADSSSAKLTRESFCTSCSRLTGSSERCPECKRQTTSVYVHRGSLNKCPACADIHTRGDIVTPLRTGTASTVSVLASHHLDHLSGEDRKLLVFADNRQDAAHQAGYSADKHRSFALRHSIAHALQATAGEISQRPLYLLELPQVLFDEYQKLGIIRGKLPQREVEQWLFALRFETANEFTRYARQRASLENLGLVAVDYEFLDSLLTVPAFRAAAAEAELTPETALLLTRAILDAMRRNRALDFDFFQEYVDPSSKRRYREIEKEPYNVRIPERDRQPRAFAFRRPDHIRKTQRLLGFVQENPKTGQLTATHRLATRVIGERAKAASFLEAIVGILLEEEHQILVEVPHFYIPKKEVVSGLKPIQINHRFVRLLPAPRGYRCQACQTWHAYDLGCCPSSRCTDGKLKPATIDRENYYVRLYLDRPPARFHVEEHSAQVSAEERVRRESAFKESKLQVLVCTPTLELGVDIGPLLTVVLRNAPPTAANYAQRVGRAGRRLRIGFVSTFCSGGAHDRYAFEHPETFVAGEFQPPRVRLDNPKIRRRHLHSFLLERLESDLPYLLREFLDDELSPTRWESELLDPLRDELSRRCGELTGAVAAMLLDTKGLGATTSSAESEPECDSPQQVVAGFAELLTETMEHWWSRVEQLKREHREFSQIGSPRHDQRKASARQRAFYELTSDPERAYTLSYLSTRGVLPSYQFPIDTFSLDPGINDTATLYRPSAIAIEEFAPGNFIYANGHKLRSIRVLFPGGPGASPGDRARSDAETAGRLRGFQFCTTCSAAVEAPRNACPSCDSQLPEVTDLLFVDAFEAEENLKIGSDEESRQRVFFERRENLVEGSASRCTVYPYPLTPVELNRLGDVLITNWGRTSSKGSAGTRFRLCPDCGRHMSKDPTDPKQQAEARAWQEQHRRFCSGEPALVVLAYKYQTDCLIVSIPTDHEVAKDDRKSASPEVITLAEALLAGARHHLELESGEIAAFVRRGPGGPTSEQIVFYETVPGGAGYLEQVARDLPQIAKAAQELLYDHDCSESCYRCLKHYGNQRWHALLNKERVRDVLRFFVNQDPVEPAPCTPGEGAKLLTRMVEERSSNLGGSLGVYPKGEIEEVLLAALQRLPELPPGERDFEIKNELETVVTVPDFAWPTVKLAVFCDGFAFHGNRDTLERDATKRNFLQRQGWGVLVYWGRTILKDPHGCARDVEQTYRRRSAGRSE